MQAAFVEHDAFQCGYCTPGQICSAVGMLDEAARGLAERASPTTASRRVELDDAEIRERMSGNLCRCGAYANIVPAIARGGRDEAVRLRAGRRRGRRVGWRGPARRYLGGGTNLVDLMKLEVETPELLVDVRDLDTSDRGDRRRRAAHRRRRHQQRPRRPPRRPRALPGARRRRCWPAPRASCATSPPSAATCSSARAARTSRTSRSRATSARPAPAARRARATTATSRSSGTPRRCVATHPSDMAVALAALDATVHVAGPAARDDPDARPAPAARRRAGARHGARAGRADRRRRAAAAAVAAQLAPTARSATGRRTRSRSSPSRSRSTRDGDGARLPDRVRRGRPRAVAGASARRRRCAAAGDRGRVPGGRRRGAGQAAEPLRDNAFKVPLARNLLVAGARGGDGDDRSGEPRRDRHAARPHRGAREGHRRGPLRLRVLAETGRLRRGRAGHGRQRRGRARRRTARADGVLAVHLGRERAAAGRGPATASWRVLQSRAVAYRGQIVAAVVAETLEAAREAAGLVRVDYDERAARRRAARPTTRLYTPEKVNPAFPSETLEGRLRGRARGRRRCASTRRTRRPPSTTTRWSRTPRVAVWEADGSLTVHDSTQGARRGAAQTLAKLFGLEPEQVRVISPHVGGGFGSKGTPRPTVVLAAMAAQGRRAGR